LIVSRCTLCNIHHHGTCDDPYVSVEDARENVAGKITLTEILAKYGLAMERSRADASLSSDRALPREQARACVAELVAAGIEASDAVDSDYRDLAWIYVDA
jgi:hypothetical protein